MSVNVALVLSLSHLVLGLLVGARVLLRPDREPASRIAWIVVITALPIGGVIAYILFGEVNVGRSRAARLKTVSAALQPLAGRAGRDGTEMVTGRYQQLFRVGQSISGMKPVAGNRGALLADSDSTIRQLVADIDAAREQVHLLFYIWLPDNNGCRVVEALQRAAARGVTVRAMADDLGSRLMIKSPHWRAMRESGVRLATALPVGNPLLRPLAGRIDLRNHSKIVVIDNSITYCGSQNCADPEFRIKAKYAPWVDAMMRFEGPIAAQNQFLFAGDWMGHVSEDLSEMLERDIEETPAGFVAQVVGTGPTVRFSAMSELFQSIMYAARQELMITTPYFVPNEAMIEALRATSFRGVKTTIVFPARNDSWVVAAASRSYYATLLEAGVQIFEYHGGLLHTKSLTVDGEVALIGSANMDRRSFDLNYENNILLVDRQLSEDLRNRQLHYIASATAVTAGEVAAWSLKRRLWNNAVAMLGPVL